MFYSEGQATFQSATQTGKPNGTIEIVFQEVYGRYGDLIQQYEISFSRMLNDILILYQLWYFLTDQTFHQFHDLDTEVDLHRIISGFYGAFATGVTWQQGTLTLPDTWFRPPFLELACPPIVETKFLELAMSLLDFSPWIPLGTFTILLLSCVANNTIKLSRHRLSFFEHEHFVFTYFLYFNISTCKVCQDMLKY